MKTKIAAILLGVLFASFAGVDPDFLAVLKQKFDSYQKKFPGVKVHLFFNQGTYSPGDTAYYQARFLTENLRPVAGKQILSLDIVNPEGKVVQHQNFSVKDGLGPNQIIIDKTIDPGIYTFTAYNEWMRNFDREFFFQKSITITGRKSITAIASPITTVNFYPEGGHLVAGVSNKVVVHAPGHSNLQILDSDNKEIAACALLNGLGFFTITPEAGKRYHASDGSGRWDIPEAGPGLALMATVDENEASPVRIVLEAANDSPLRGEELYLVVAAQTNIYFTGSLQFGDKAFLQVAVPRVELPGGIARTSVLNRKGEVLAERLFYVAKGNEPRVTITPEKTVYQPREKVVSEVLLLDDSGNGIAGNLAVSVSTKKLFREKQTISLSEELLLASDLGYPDSDFISPSGEGWFQKLDLYLITKKWNRLPWREILADPYSSKKFGFRNTLNIAGRAVDKITGQPVPDSTLVMVYLQNHMMGYESYITQNGEFDLPFLFDFWGTDQVFYLMEQKKKELPNAMIVLPKDSIIFGSGVRAAESDQVDLYGDFRFKKALIDNSYAFYSLGKSSPKKLLNTNEDFEDEVTGADVAVNVEDYIVFPTMEDLIREVIPSLQYRKIGGKPAVRVLLSEVNANPNQRDPLYVINGVMTKNTEYFLSLKPADVVTVKIVKDISKLSRFGALGKNGMVLIQTKKNDPKLNELSTLLPVEGLSKPLAFHSPDYSTKNNRRIPDFRSTLYWNPSLTTSSAGKATISFYLSDDTGPVRIRLEGMTADGRPFSKDTEINVVFGLSKN